MKNTLRITAALLLGLALLLSSLILARAAPLAQAAQDGQAIFEAKCAACHTIGGGKLVGPDLEGVVTRRELGWLSSFIQSPDKMIADGDPTAVQLLAEYNNVAMPNLMLSDAEVEALLAYLENPQAGGAAPAAPPAALPAGAVLSGQKLFTGETGLQMGGPGCFACHSVSGNGALGGGSLGPDLTHAVSRLSEAGLTSALANIVYPTMQGPFLNRPLTAQEQADLIAYLKWADQSAPPAAPYAAWLFPAIALGGTVLLFAGMLVFWPRQRQSLAQRLRAQGGKPTTQPHRAGSHPFGRAGNSRS